MNTNQAPSVTHASANPQCGALAVAPCSASLPPGRDNLPLDHPRRIAQIAQLSERELAHEPIKVRQLCRDYREQLLATHLRSEKQAKCERGEMVVEAESMRDRALNVARVAVDQMALLRDTAEKARLAIIAAGSREPNTKDEPRGPKTSHDEKQEK